MQDTEIKKERKKIILYGSEHCVNCHPVKEILDSNNVKYSFVDITSGMPQLQYFLKLRDVSDAFSPVRGSGKIGIPCLQVNDDAYVVQGPEHAQSLIDGLELVR